MYIDTGEHSARSCWGHPLADTLGEGCHPSDHPDPDHACQGEGRRKQNLQWLSEPGGNTVGFCVVFHEAILFLRFL